MRSAALPLAVVAIGLPLLAGWAFWRAELGGEAGRLEALAETRLNIANARLEGQLARFRQLPRVLADAAPLAEAVASGGSAARQEANLLLERMADVTGALDIYLMDREGLTVAASNWASPTTFVGANFSYRPYFQRAMDGGLGMFYALGTTSGRRCFYFASPLRLDGEIVGAAVVKADMDAVEAEWRDAGETIYFTDPSGVVFLANVPGMVLRTSRALSDAELHDLAATRRYDAAPLTALPQMRRESWAPAWLLGLDAPGWEALPGVPARAFHAEAPNPRLDLTANVLLNAEPSLARALRSGVAAGAVTLALTLLALLVLQRRRAYAQRLVVEARAKAELERRVEARTSDLSEANARLRSEVTDRRAAEAALRRAQDDLVQAGKLSALGQMSAGISHELNQPLAAIRSFADNARVLLDRGRQEEASANLGQISDLTARMARIIRNLRAFARKEGEPATDVALDRVVADALALLEPRIEAEGADIRWTPPAAPVLVRGGGVRLTQVAVNVLSNAIDAMAGQAEQRIDVSVETPPGGPVRLIVRDRGPGLSDEAGSRLFDPFYTTKTVGQGEGLGLGLSISYGIVQSFGGAIRGENHPGGGAVFTVELTPAAAREAA